MMPTSPTAASLPPLSSAVLCVDTPTTALPLHDATTARQLETHALAQHPPHALMQAAGWALARWVLALAPHARRIWVVCGPGNNGGNGLVAARWLHQWGKSVEVSLLGDPARLPHDAAHALASALDAGLQPHPQPEPQQPPDVIVDALLGLGQSRAPAGALAQAVRAMARARHPPHTQVLAVDLPTGLCADSGQPLGDPCVRADATLALLSLKPGLYTGQGRDWAGSLWWAPLLAPSHPAWQTVPASAGLIGQTDVRALLALRQHAQHKGSFGDVWVIGGSAGMAGAAQLAARAALHAGAGRVYLAPAAADGPPPGADPLQPELMHRLPRDWRASDALATATVVCGCGGGTVVADVLPEVLAHSARLVLDADALNAVAARPTLRAALVQRAQRQQATVLTPHPLEAARLLGSSTAQVQARRSEAAQRLAQQLHAVVVLKGSGSVLAQPDGHWWLNPTGNARLATPGSGDVLAGWLGGLWSTQGAGPGAQDVAQARRCAAAAIWLHGQAALGDTRLPLPAAALIAAMGDAVRAL